MNDAHAAQTTLASTANELPQRFARLIGAQSMKIELILRHPAAAAQLAQHIWPDAAAGVAECLDHFQKRIDAEVIRQRFLQHRLIISDALACHWQRTRHWG